MMVAMFLPEQIRLWDLAVYGSAGQCVSTVLGLKTATDRRRLLPMSPTFDAADDEALLRYVVQHVEPSWPSMAAPPTAVDYTPITQGESDPELEALVGMLGERTATPYDTWRNVGIILKEASGGGDRHLHLFDEFSRRGGTSYDGPESVRAMWASLNVHADRGVTQRLTVGTLRYFARRDSPEAYRTWAAAERGRAVHIVDLPSEAAGPSDAVDTVDAVKEAVHSSVPGLLAALRARFPEFGLDASSFRVGQTTDERVVVAGYVEAAFRRVSVSRGGPDVPPTFAGLLHRDVPCDGTMSDIHAYVPVEASRFVFNQDDDDAAVIRSVTPGVGATLTMHRPNRADACVSVSVPGKPAATVKAKATLATLKGRLQEALERVDLAGGIVQLFVNNGTVNNNHNTTIVGGGECPRRTDECLVLAVLEACPKLRERIKFAPSSKTGNCNGLYCCDEVTSVWVQRHNVVIEEMLAEAFRAPGVKLDAAERRHVQSRRGRCDMVHMLGAKVHDDQFIDRLDANLDSTDRTSRRSSSR